MSFHRCTKRGKLESRSRDEWILNIHIIERHRQRGVWHTEKRNSGLEKSRKNFRYLSGPKLFSCSYTPFPPFVHIFEISGGQIKDIRQMRGREVKSGVCAHYKRIRHNNQREQTHKCNIYQEKSWFFCDKKRRLAISRYFIWSVVSIVSMLICFIQYMAQSLLYNSSFLPLIWSLFILYCKR